jgi:ribonuclease P protein component
MQKKHQRLTGKDIAYMLKKAKKRAGSNFLVYCLPQYSHRQYHQWSFTISLKIDKRAVKRNYLKRLLVERFAFALREHHPKYAKFFILPHKHMLEQRKQLIATRDKTTIRKRVQGWLDQDIAAIFSCIQ